MNRLLFYLVFSNIEIVLSVRLYEKEWNHFKKNLTRFSFKINSNVNESERFSIFTKNMKIVESHNSKNSSSFKMGVNEYSHVSFDEFSSRFLPKPSGDISKFHKYSNIKVSDANTPIIDTNSNNSSVNSTYLFNSNTSIPDSIDWNAKGYVSLVKNQGSCGCCYAFTTTGAVESALAIYNNFQYPNITLLSEQQLIDCTSFNYVDPYKNIYRNYGCNGGNLVAGLNFIYFNGIMLGSQYPYNSGSYSGSSGYVQSCKYIANSSILKLTNFYSISSGNTTLIKAAVAKQPLMTHYYATNDFKNYKSGIFSSSSCSNIQCRTSVNHAVLITGYGSSNGIQYWIVKNSWGTSWGESGYFRIPIGSSVCCIEYLLFYPSLNTSYNFTVQSGLLYSNIASKIGTFIKNIFLLTCFNILFITKTI